MSHLRQLYNDSLSLLTDLYQLTMAYGYWKTQKHDQEACFTLFFRQPPFKGGYTLAAGFNTVVDYVQQLHFAESDLNYLATLTDSREQPLFEAAFLDYLQQLQFTCAIDSVPEGTVVFAHEPLLRVQGNLVQCQLLETALLNIINFQTLIATKAARICQAAQGQPVLDFGLRRAQGIDGGLTAVRAAYIGGCSGTSNVLAGKYYGIPVKGTHAHSWVMSFSNELEAFQAYAEAMPNNCILLVDTFDSITGIENAIKIGQQLQQRHHQLLGIRLDSGDLVSLSQKARVLLDAAGLTDSHIVASNELDEYQIAELKAQGAKINLWGVGTRLITSYDQPALGGVYKLTAIRSPGAPWQLRLKTSDEPLKTSNPGWLQLRRFTDDNGVFIQDMIYDQLHPPGDPATLIQLADGQAFTVHQPYQDLLVPLLRQGQCVAELPSLKAIQVYAQQQLACCPEAIKSIDKPTAFAVGLEQGLYHLKQELIQKFQNNT